MAGKVNTKLMVWGILLIFHGIFVFVSPSLYDFRSGAQVDITGYNKPWEIACVAAGILLVCKSFSKKYKPDPKVTLIGDLKILPQ